MSVLLFKFSISKLGRVVNKGEMKFEKKLLLRLRCLSFVNEDMVGIFFVSVLLFRLR